MSSPVGTGDFQYDFIDDWATTGPDGARVGGPTHGVAVDDDGRVIVFHQNDPGGHAFLVYDREGRLADSFGDQPGAHGLSRMRDGSFWITDETTCVVRHYSDRGDVLLELPPPPQADIGTSGRHPRFVPTWADVAPDGVVWVADGYGSFGVFRYDADGNYLGRFDADLREPHGLAFSPEGELYIADRGRQTVRVYDAAGRFLRSSATACHSPSSFAFHDGLVYVAEIAGSVKILDRELDVLADLAPNPVIRPNPQGHPNGWWPDEVQRAGGYPNLPRDALPSGRFWTPHGVAVAPSGDVFVVEWYRGGRIIKLRRR